MFVESGEGGPPLATGTYSSSCCTVVYAETETGSAQTTLLFTRDLNFDLSKIYISLGLQLDHLDTLKYMI